MNEHTTFRTYRFRLYPSRPQERTLRETLYLTRSLYNAALEQRIAAYRKHSKTLSAFDQCKELSALKEECPEFKGVYSHVLQEPLERLERAFKAFFVRMKRGERPGFPRFKPASRWNSFKFKEVWDQKNDRWKGPGRPIEDGRRINISKIGAVKVKFHRTMEGKPETLQIVLDVDQWYAVYTCEVRRTPLAETGSAVGVDVGTIHFAITSDGEFVENPRHLGRSLRKLRVQQRTVARRKKGSRRRKKAVRQVAKTHRKVRRARLDFHHKVARQLVSAHDVIAHEDLRVSNMVKSTLSRSISDVGWAQFFDILSLKAESAGRTVIRVDPRYTSQRCHACGHTGKENRVNQATFKCVKCGHTANADVNAAKNILGRACPSGGNDSEVSHVVA